MIPEPHCDSDELSRVKERKCVCAPELQVHLLKDLAVLKNMFYRAMTTLTVSRSAMNLLTSLLL